jgi:hypothetical protein
MKLLLENWRQFINEEPDPFAKQLIEEGLLDIVKDRGASIKALKNKVYDQALKQFISLSGKISDKSAPVKTIIQKYLPSPVQMAALTAISLAIAAAGKPDLAQKIIAGSVSVTDVMGALSGMLEKQEVDEAGTLVHRT